MSLTEYYRWYDRLYAAKDYDAEAALVLGRMARLIGRPPRKLLEVGCGTGNHTAAFCRDGALVTAVDLEADAIAVARSKAIAGAAFHALPVAEIVDGGFDGAYSLFNVVNYIPDDIALGDFLRGVHDRLSPGAPFVFDCWNGVAALLDPPKVKEVRLTGDDGLDVTVTTTPALDPMDQTVEMTTDFSGVDEHGRTVRFTQSYRHRLWTPRELRERLDQHGLAVDRVSAWMDPDRAATAADWKILFVCRRA